VRVGKVAHPLENKWSSYRYYAHGEADPLITPSPSYLGLGNTPEQRQALYSLMVELLMESKKVLNISHTYFIGNPDWVIRKYEEFRKNVRHIYQRYRHKTSSPISTAPPDQLAKQ